MSCAAPGESHEARHRHPAAYGAAAHGGTASHTPGGHPAGARAQAWPSGPAGDPRGSRTAAAAARWSEQVATWAWGPAGQHGDQLPHAPAAASAGPQQKGGGGAREQHGGGRGGMPRDWPGHYARGYRFGRDAQRHGKGPRPTRPPKGSGTWHEFQTCRHWLRGNCTNGARCKFNHFVDPKEEAAEPAADSDRELAGDDGAAGQGTFEAGASSSSVDDKINDIALSFEAELARLEAKGTR